MFFLKRRTTINDKIQNLWNYKFLILIAIASGIFSVTVTLYMTSSNIIKHSISILESEIIEKDLERVADAFNSQLENIKIFNDDYASWDETYEFAKNLNDGYRESNLIIDTYKGFDINLILMLDTQKKIIYGKYYDESRKELASIEVQKAIINNLIKNLGDLKNFTVYKSIIKTNDGLWLSTAVPILTSSSKGPPRGIMLMSRLLQTSDLEKLARFLDISFELYLFQDRPIEAKKLYQEILKENNSILIKHINEGLSYGYKVLVVNNGSPPGIIRVTNNRLIYKNGLLSLKYLKITLFSLNILFIVVAGKLLDYTEKQIKKRNKAELFLRKEQELSYTTFNSISDGVIVTNRQNVITFLNPVAEVLTGWSNSQAIGQPLEKVYNIVEAEDVPLKEEKQIWTLEDEDSFFESTAYKVLISRSGEQYAIDGSESAIQEKEEIIGFVVVFRDVSKLQELTHQLAKLASYDPLTNLVNRRGFEYRLKKALNQFLLSSQSDYCLALIDLDHFKYVNDNGGHLAGDELLRRLSALFTQIIPPQHTLARVGGDEFGLIFVDCNITEALLIAQELCEATKIFSFSWQNQVFWVGTSIGLVTFDKEVNSIDVLLASADEACYIAKKNGRGRVHVRHLNSKAG